jgi:hypothetical protein
VSSHASLTFARAAVATSLCGAVLALALPAAAEPGFGSVQSMQPPIGSSNPPDAPYGAVSCPTTTQCIAVGASGHVTGEGKPTVITENSGVWGTPSLVAVPAGGTYGGQDPSALAGISCPDATDCTAVGSYTTSVGTGRFPMVVDDVGGIWGPATTPPLPADLLSDSKGEDAELTAVQCASADGCVAVGDFIGADKLVHTMVSVETAGAWAAPTELQDVPGNSALNFALPTSIACTDAADCVAIAYSLNLSTFSFVSYAWTEAAGVWSAPVKLTAAGNQPFFAEGVACPDSTTCIAVGSIGSLVALRPGYAVETSGTWHTAEALALPKLSPLAAAGTFNGISCDTDAVCEAVGVFAPSTNSPTSVAGAATWSSGLWSSIGYVRGATAAGRPSNAAALLAVSCASTSACTAIGAAGVVPSSAANPPQYPFSAVLTPTRALVAPLAPIEVGASGIADGALLRWQPPLDDGGAVVATYTATVAGHSCHTASDACAVRGLVNGQRYRVSVADATSFGTSAPGSGFAVAGAPPRPPAGIRVVGGDGQVDVSWHAAVSPGETVRAYLVTLVGPHRSTRHCVSASLDCRVGGLARHASYLVDVVAVNASGPSVPSVKVRATTT